MDHKMDLKYMNILKTYACISGLEFQILRGTHFKATVEGHLRPLHTKEYQVRGATEAMASRWPWGKSSPAAFYIRLKSMNPINIII